MGGRPAKPVTDGQDTERRLAGVTLSGGIAIGRLHVMRRSLPDVPEHRIDAGQTEDELARLHDAIGRAQRQLDKLKRKARALPATAAEEAMILLDAHAAMLSGSRLIRGAEKRIREQQANAALAVHEELSSMAEQFSALADDYLISRLTDIHEVGSRLIRNLLAQDYSTFANVPPGHLLVAESLTPADVALIDPDRIAGFATIAGGAEGHTAIMARSIGIPAVSGLNDLLDHAGQGELCIIDGNRGLVVIAPSAATRAEYDAAFDAQRSERMALARLATLPAVTGDGEAFRLEANLEPGRGVGAALTAGAQGIGLLRTEFLYMNRDTPPDIAEQTGVLAKMVRGMQGAPVTIRTLDVSPDKGIAAPDGTATRIHAGPLGVRGIRLGRLFPDMFRDQLSAIVRAAAFGPVRILLPMVTHVEELHWARRELAAVTAQIAGEGPLLPTQKHIPLGAMIEVPAAALAADALAEEADFFAIGTNDLTQYVLAIDRADEQVARLYDPCHPALLRLIQFAAEAAARARIDISICGELAADLRFVPLLAGLGIRNFSTAPGRLPAVKRRIRTMSYRAAHELALQAMRMTDPAKIHAALLAFDGDASGENTDRPRDRTARAS